MHEGKVSKLSKNRARGGIFVSFSELLFKFCVEEIKKYMQDEF